MGCSPYSPDSTRAPHYRRPMPGVKTPLAIAPPGTKLPDGLFASRPSSFAVLGRRRPLYRRTCPGRQRRRADSFCSSDFVPDRTLEFSLGQLPTKDGRKTNRRYRGHRPRGRIIGQPDDRWLLGLEMSAPPPVAGGQDTSGWPPSRRSGNIPSSPTMNFDSLCSAWKRLLNVFSKNGTPSSSALRELIRGVDESSGYARNEARAQAKTWLLGHASTLRRGDILFAREQLGYLLPAGWGVLGNTSSDSP